MSDEQDRKDVEEISKYMDHNTTYAGPVTMRWAFWRDRVKIVFPMNVGSLEMTAAEARRVGTMLIDLARKADPDGTGQPSAFRFKLAEDESPPGQSILPPREPQ